MYTFAAIGLITWWRARKPLVASPDPEEDESA